MKSPLCEECLKNKILCSECKKKVESNLISRDEIDVLKFIYKLSLKNPSLSGIKIVKVMNRDVLLIITGRGDAAKLVGKGGSIVKLIAKNFKKSIRILEQASDFKEFVEELVNPAVVSGINTLYREDEEIIRIRVPEFHRSHMLLSPEDFSQIVSHFFKRKAELVFEV